MSAETICGFETYPARRDFGPPSPFTHVGNFQFVSRPNIAEQMGVDPVSKLAVAIHDLADALRQTAQPTEDAS